MSKVLLDSYVIPSTGSGSTVMSAYGWIEAAQSFNSGVGGVLDSVEWYMARRGNPPENIIAKVFAHGGTYGINSVPTGPPLAVSDPVLAVTLNPHSTPLDDRRWVAFPFSGINRIVLPANTPLVHVVYYGLGDLLEHQISFGDDSVTASHPGNHGLRSLNRPWHTMDWVDAQFKVWAESAPAPTPGPEIVLPPTNLKVVKASTKVREISYSASATPAIEQYVIQRSSNGSAFVEIARVATLTFTDKTAHPKKGNSYRVAAMKGGALSAFAEKSD